jgi:hypothetical protein
MQTFRKLPKAKPKTATVAYETNGGIYTRFLVERFLVEAAFRQPLFLLVAAPGAAIMAA